MKKPDVPQSDPVQSPTGKNIPEKDPPTGEKPLRDPKPKTPSQEAPTDPDTKKQGEIKF